MEQTRNRNEFYCKINYISLNDEISLAVLLHLVWKLLIIFFSSIISVSWLYLWLFTRDGRELISWFRSTWNTLNFVLGFLFLVLPLCMSAALPGLTALCVMVDANWETQLVLKTPWKSLKSSLLYPFEGLISLTLAFSGRPGWGQMITLGIKWIVSYVNILY